MRAASRRAQSQGVPAPVHSLRTLPCAVMADTCNACDSDYGLRCVRARLERGSSAAEGSMIRTLGAAVLRRRCRREPPVRTSAHDVRRSHLADGDTRKAAAVLER